MTNAVGGALLVCLGAAVLYGVYRLAFDTAPKWKVYSWPILIINILFYGLAGYGFAALALTGLINQGEVDYQIALTIFIALVVTGSYGFWRSLTINKHE